MDHQESSGSVLLPEVDIHKSSVAFPGASLFQYKAFGFWSPGKYQTPATTVNHHNICDFLDNCFYLWYIFLVIKRLRSEWVLCGATLYEILDMGLI